MKNFKPMLAGKAVAELIRYPVLASPKIDGVRGCIVDGQLRSRSLKPFANRHVQRVYSDPRLNGMDGEFVLGEPFAKDVCRKTTAALIRIEYEPAVTFWAFDTFTDPQAAYLDRAALVPALVANLGHPNTHECTIFALHHEPIHNAEQLAEYEEVQVLENGYEGIMIRDPYGQYKYGRSTTKEGGLLKVKRFEDMEAHVVGIEEEMHNTNEATVSELGRTKRSSHAAGKVGKGTMGALVCEGLLNSPFPGVRFNVGTGFTALDRKRTDWVGKIIRVKYLGVGVKDKPRHPVFLTERMESDL